MTLLNKKSKSYEFTHTHNVYFTLNSKNVYKESSTYQIWFLVQPKLHFWVPQIWEKGKGRKILEIKTER